MTGPLLGVEKENKLVNKPVCQYVSESESVRGGSQLVRLLANWLVLIIIIIIS